MEFKSLRFGNWVVFLDKSTRIGYHHLALIALQEGSGRLTAYSPVGLTPQMLKRYGFVLREHHADRVLWQIPLIDWKFVQLEHCPGPTKGSGFALLFGSSHYGGGGGYRVTLQGLHHIQNFIHDITGQDLFTNSPLK